MAGRLIRLSEGGNGKTVRFVCGLPKQLGDGLGGAAPQNWVTITRTGSFHDPRYGKFEITRSLLEEMKRNFEANAYGQKIFLDVAHKPENGAAAEVLKLAIEGDRLRALVAWTPKGVKAIKEDGYRYLSAEYHENFVDNESGKSHGCVLLGAGLVTRPCIKRLDPITLGEATGSSGAAILLHPTLLSELINEVNQAMNKHLEALRKQLQEKGLSEAAIKSLMDAAAKAIDGQTDEQVVMKLCEGLLASAQHLAPGQMPGPISLSVGMSDAQVGDLVAKKLAEQQESTRQLAEKSAAQRKLLSDSVGEKITDGETVKKLIAPYEALLGNMDDAAIKALAGQLIALGEPLMAFRQLSGMGFEFRGSAHIEVPDEAPNKLAGLVRDALKLTDACQRGALAVPEKDSAFVGKVLGAFDRAHGHKLHAEHRMLSGGDANTGEYYFPAGIQREVIRVALSDLNILNLVRTNVDPAAQATTEIPFEVRPAFSPANDGVVYEGQAIPRHQILNDHETAFITPMKIGMAWTNELAHFTRRGLVNWDAVAENMAANARTMRELISRRVANELQRAGDSFQAIAVANENIAAQLTGANSIIKTANFPVVRPFQARDLKGNAVGDAEHPVAVVVNGSAVQPWDGSGKQAAGTYWRLLSSNLGYFQLVDKDGTPATPTAASACTIGYSKVTNIVKVDLDVPNGKTLEQHLNKVLQAIGARKAMLSGQRFVAADFALMSPTLNDTLSNAESFVESMQRNGAATNAQGDLATVKGLPAFGTNQPGIDLGDERIMIAPRGLLGYTISKPFAIEGQPFEMVDGNGHPIGKKQVYGEEYNAIHVPGPVRGYLTGVLCYSASSR